MTSRGIPFDELERILERLDDAREGGSDLAVDVEDVDGRFEVTADIPGFRTEDIEVEVQDRTVRIDAEHAEAGEVEDSEGEYVRRERSERSASRSVTLPEAVEEDAASATFENGVLTVKLPKASASGAGTTVNIE